MARTVLEEVGLTDIAVLVQDGAAVKAGDIVMTVRGDTRAILLAERTALNFLGHLSGIATRAISFEPRNDVVKSLLRIVVRQCQVPKFGNDTRCCG